MPDPSIEYRNKFLVRQIQYDSKFRTVFGKTIDDYTRLSKDPNIKFSKSFKYNKAINKKIDKITKSFHQNVLNLAESEIEKSWGLSNDKNDLIVKDYLAITSRIAAEQKALYFSPNIPALKAFISGKGRVESLSESIWEIALQFEGEMKIHLGLGIMNGDSAAEISRTVRQFLKNPDARFRRVRNSKGQLVASRPMIANAPGQGVYNSAFKNAMRVTRTNTNQAYLLSDHLRWNNLPMVIGVKISLSAQHKVYDICDELTGVYPKDFIWVGWHPQDLCHAVPVMMPKEDFNAYLKGDQPLNAKQITKIPENFKRYMKENYERYLNYKQLPYFIQDNQKVINQILKEK